MAFATIVEKVNADVKKELAEAKGHRENPRLIRLMEAFVLLTNDDEENEKILEAQEAEKPKCPHDLVKRDGTCNACGEKVLAAR